MYGHAVLLRHVPAKRLLSCLTTSPGNDKMAYDIGFTRRGEGEIELGSVDINFLNFPLTHQ